MDKLQPTCNRRCPKLSDAHVDIANNSLTKMRIFFAVQILEDYLKWLDEWEKRVEDNLIPREYFLTDITAEGLRMTVRSTIDLANYFLREKQYNVVLTAKINQDPLERFFGAIRLSGGTNDHPATPTFLQIYKILTFYSILKPAKSGNCKVSDDALTDPLIPMSELKEIYNTDKKESSIKRIQEK